MIERLADDLAKHLDAGSPGPPPLLDSPGATPERIGELYAAAAEFYRRAPWRSIPGDSVIELTCDAFESGPWYALVMGQSGILVGLALYDDAEGLRTILSGRASDEEAARATSALSVTYGEAFDVPPRELDAVEQHGWPVADPDAYPVVTRINPGMSVRVPLGWELDLLEAALRAIPAFLESDAQDERKPTSIRTGTLTVTLSIVD